VRAAVLIVEDEASLARNIAKFLERAGFEAQAASNGEQALALFETMQPDFLLTDLRLPGGTGIDVLRAFRSRWPDTPAAIMTAHGDVDSAVEALKLGAVDYLSKPVILRDVERLVRRVLEDQRRAHQLQYFARREPGREGLAAIFGESPAIVRLKATIDRLIANERRLGEGAAGPPVLITGETGTGKELVARALHFEGPRAGQPFVELNCAALPTPLVEAELFGHERGAFTDARERRLGLVEAADGGTLFLDEVGDLDPEIQVKLLKLLEDRRVRRVGANRDREVDVRIVAATNQSLEDRVNAGRFRSDLYFRLRIVQLEIPPLRDRPEDIDPLARRFLAEAAARYRRQGLSLGPAARRALATHSWPGNVRELRNAIEQAVAIAPSALLEPADLRLSAVARAGAGAQTLGLLPEGGVSLEALERGLIEQALGRANWNVTAAARLLGLTRDTLRYRIEKFDLRPGP
jgi:DNA-binding NtrC family response regulator